MATSEILDPRKTKTIALYKDPNSETFGNLKQSAIRAGFDDQYANTLLWRRPIWLMDNIANDVDRIKQAEKNIDDVNTYALPIDDVQSKRDVEILKSKLDVSKFILKTQARAKYNDDEQKAQTNVQVNIINYDDEPTVTVHTAPIDPIGQ